MISKKMLLDNTGKDISAKLKKMNYNLITYLKNGNDKSISELISGNIQEFEDENIINIKQYLFRECRKLIRVNLPKCTNVGDYAFMYCSSLENVTLPECIELGTTVFGYCEKLKSIDLPKCTNVGDYAFYYCAALTGVILRSSTVCKLKGMYAFSNTPIAKGTGYIYVPDKLVQQYKTAYVWNEYANQIKPLSEYTE